MLQVTPIVLAAVIGTAAAGLCVPPEPWTPVSVKGRTVSCWGRNYSYGSSVLPSQIITQSENILAGPVRITAKANGQNLRWERAAFTTLTCDAESAQYVTRAHSDQLSVECRFKTEFDGVTRVDLLLKPKGRVKIYSLDIVFPLKSDCATLFHHYPAGPVYEWDWPTKRMNSA